MEIPVVFVAHVGLKADVKDVQVVVGEFDARRIAHRMDGRVIHQEGCVYFGWVVPVESRARVRVENTHQTEHEAEIGAAGGSAIVVAHLPQFAYAAIALANLDGNLGDRLARRKEKTVQNHVVRARAQGVVHAALHNLVGRLELARPSRTVAARDVALDRGHRRARLEIAHRKGARRVAYTHSEVRAGQQLAHVARRATAIGAAIAGAAGALLRQLGADGWL